LVLSEGFAGFEGDQRSSDMSETVGCLGFGGGVKEEAVCVWDVFMMDCDDP
jgi:hypothetical protein